MAIDTHNELTQLARQMWPQLSEKYGSDQPIIAARIAQQKYEASVKSKGQHMYRAHSSLSRAADLLLLAILAEIPQAQVLEIVSAQLQINQDQIIQAARAKAHLILGDKAEYIAQVMQSILDQCPACGLLKGHGISDCMTCGSHQDRQFDRWLFWQMIADGSIGKIHNSCRMCNGDLGARTANDIYCFNGCSNPVQQIRRVRRRGGQDGD